MFEKPSDIRKEARRSYERLRPRLEIRFKSATAQQSRHWHSFLKRLEDNFERLFGLLLHLYGSHYDFFYHLEELLVMLADSWLERPEDLKQLDLQREADPSWFQSHHFVGGVCYVDLFAENLQGIKARIPYFKELGIGYLHLMPLFRSPEGENDGGYAISSYREVNPAHGNMAQLIELAATLRKNNISLVLDFVFNHTSSEHEWALRARGGDEEYQNFYRMYPDRQMPDAYERNLREIFPEEHPGAFTFFPDINRWVWTTFHSNQWDLNYANPRVFTQMAAEMLFLANAGVEVLRLDAVAFIWKELGTNCENLPEAHLLIQAFNTIARIAAPAVIFKSEAIVHPDDVVRYIHPGECQLSYNPLLMALLWESLATRDVRLLAYSLQTRFKIHPQCAWVNYVRCHDDIGWTFSDEDAASLGISAYDHRRFLNDFYTGKFPGSFARGLPFQENPHTGDVRISGTCASLAGLEKALVEETDNEVELALRRILLIHSIILSIGGIPLIYLGDEIAILNDYSFREDAAKMHDSRWVHRPRIDWKRYENRDDSQTIEGRLYQRLKNLIHIRQVTPAFGAGETEFFHTDSKHVLGFIRYSEAERIIVLANFSEQPQELAGNLIRLYGLDYRFIDLVSEKEYTSSGLLRLDGFQFVWLKASD